jgi:hypothetical protein
LSDALALAAYSGRHAGEGADFAKLRLMQMQANPYRGGL